MGNSPDQIREEGRVSRFFTHLWAVLSFGLKLPFQVAARVAAHLVQILFAIFVLVLHPQVKWLINLISDSAIVQNYVKPSLRTVDVHIYQPYFQFLSRLHPYWATFSIALPLAILEPAKFTATILIAERPKTGILLWLALQGLSLILIDRTWLAVRPQSRKIRPVARLHAWIWLNATYGKYWIRQSLLYRAAMRWKKQARRTARAFWALLMPRRRRRTM